MSDCDETNCPCAEECSLSAPVHECTALADAIGLQDAIDMAHIEGHASHRDLAAAEEYVHGAYEALRRFMERQAQAEEADTLSAETAALPEVEARTERRTRL